MSTATKTVPLCCVRIGYESFIMPADKGMVLVKILSSSFNCEKRYEGGYVYEVGEQPEVEYTLVKPSQIKLKVVTAAGQRLLT